VFRKDSLPQEFREKERNPNTKTGGSSIAMTSGFNKTIPANASEILEVVLTPI